jgi:hypothetical protein
MGSHKHKAAYDNNPRRPPAPPPPPDAFVSDGTPPSTPACAGAYFQKGTHNGYPKYQRDVGDWWIWYSVGDETWYISLNVGGADPGRWGNHSETITDNPYTALGIYSGNVNVSLNT